MAVFFKGAGIGTYWHTNDATVVGFTPRQAGVNNTSPRIVQHVAKNNVVSPCISFSRSFEVAKDYAIRWGTTGTTPTSHTPAYVYEVELNDPLPSGVTLFDPVIEIARALPVPQNLTTYQHKGDVNLLASILTPSVFGFTTNALLGVTDEFAAIAFALRDAEILVFGKIPVKNKGVSVILKRHLVY